MVLFQRVTIGCNDKTVKFNFEKKRVYRIWVFDMLRIFFQDEYYIKTEHKVSGKRSFSTKAFV